MIGLYCATDGAGKIMMEGEFNAMAELYKSMPSFVPRPRRWGKFCLSWPETYFFLCDFIDMSNELPDPKRFCSRLAELHCVSESPTGKFGFHVPTCHGRFPQFVEWDGSWTSFFTKLLDDVLRRDVQNNGPWLALEKVSQRALTHVIPRLIGALELNGRSVKPSLIHGDLWEGNIGTEFDTGDIYVFDAGAYYAHNEMEIGMWRCERHKIRSEAYKEAYKEAYLRNSTVSEPADEWDDRNRIYCVKMNMIHSAHHAGDMVRQTAFEDMCYLVDKYAPWSPEELDDETRKVFLKAVEDAKSH
ncbi:hypothetical protein MMC07_004641 [Pseudocyphellaria aurata]|nr:hypothetical protein [Pseudocyphellaria aurata]